MLLSRFIAITCLTLVLLSCNTEKSKNQLALNSTTEVSTSQKTAESRNLPANFGNYWYAGTAEITSYNLSQSRYGEQREGSAVTIFVTEDFDAQQQVKSDRQKDGDIPMLKLNTTKKFNTGIYPYSIMTSVFNPVSDTRHSLKLVNSVQEWCGQTYMQLNNQEQFEIQTNSYFQSEGDQKINLDKTVLEDEIWNLIRLNPSELPEGTFDIIPSFENFRLAHKEIKAYPAEGSLKSDSLISTYTLVYPQLKRSIAITFNAKFPHEISNWVETHANGETTTATIINRIQSAYWSKKATKDIVLRDSLGLK